VASSSRLTRTARSEVRVPIRLAAAITRGSRRKRWTSAWFGAGVVVTAVSRSALLTVLRVWASET
jgi:hypothetical protein